MSLQTLLRVNGRIPRRAVLLADGVLGDRCQHPGVQEVDLLSRLCEVARATSGEPTYPRDTAALLQAALCDNCPGAWTCIRDDLSTGDLDLDVAAAVLRQDANASALVACLVGARDNKHLLCVACLLSQTMDRVGQETRAEMGRSLACQLRAVVDALTVHGGMMNRDVRDALLDGFGRILATTGIPDVRIAEMVVHALTTRRDELLRLFLHVPPTFVDHRPQVLPMLMDRARAASPTSVYPVMALLARVIAAHPEALAGHEAEVADVVCHALPDGLELDARTCLTTACFVLSTNGASGMPVALARALKACSASLISRLESGFA